MKNQSVGNKFLILLCLLQVFVLWPYVLYTSVRDQNFQLLPIGLGCLLLAMALLYALCAVQPVSVCLGCGTKVKRRKNVLFDCDLDQLAASSQALYTMISQRNRNGHMPSYSIRRTKFGRTKYDGIAMEITPRITRVTQCPCCHSPLLWTGDKLAATMIVVKDYEHVHPATCN